MRESYFHEDDYCQVEIVPATNYEFCRNQLDEIVSFSAKHDTGFGWTDMYIRSDAPAGLSSIRLSKSDLELELASYLPTFDRVFTGYSTHREECGNTTAFGASGNFVLYAEYDADIVSRLWLTMYGLSSDDIENAVHLLKYLSRFQLMLIDWSMSAIVVLEDADAIRSYLHEFAANPPPT